MFFVYKFHISLAPLWIQKYAVFTLLHRLKSPIHLSYKQQKVSLELLEKHKFFLVKNYTLLGIKSVHGRRDSPSQHTNPLPYIVPTRVEPHCQLHSLLVHWSYREKKYPCNTIKMQRCTLTKGQRVRRANNCTYRCNRSIL